MSVFKIQKPTNQFFLQQESNVNVSENKTGYIINFAADVKNMNATFEYSLVYNGNITMHPQYRDSSETNPPYYPINTNYYIMKNSVIKSVKIQQEIYNQNDNILLISGTQSTNINDFSSMQLIEENYLSIYVNPNSVIATGKTMIELYIENV